MSDYYHDTPSAFRCADRVEAHPGCDCWMRGDRFGRVVRVGRKYVAVVMDRSGRILKFTPDRLAIVASKMEASRS